MLKLTIVCLFIVAICIVAAQECQEGETKQVDCNSCRCANGNWACTRRGCVHKREAQECQSGQTKQESCNTCTCANGNWACTRKFCLRKREAVEDNVEVTREKREVMGAEELAITPCAPNDYFQLDCNVCYCKTDRTGYLCTDNTCSDEAWALSTTTQIPLSNDSMLIMSNYGIELIEKVNSNDNSISRIANIVKTEPLTHETVDPEIINLDSKTDDLESAESRTADSGTVLPESADGESVKPKPNEPETVESPNVESATVECASAELATVESACVESATVESATDEPATVESTTVESVSVESQTVKTETGDSVSKPSERKSSPRNPLIIADEQRRLAALRNQ